MLILLLGIPAAILACGSTLRPGESLYLRLTASNFQVPAKFAYTNATDPSGLSTSAFEARQAVEDLFVYAFGRAFEELVVYNKPSMADVQRNVQLTNIEYTPLQCAFLTRVVGTTEPPAATKSKMCKLNEISNVIVSYCPSNCEKNENLVEVPAEYKNLAFDVAVSYYFVTSNMQLFSQNNYRSSLERSIAKFLPTYLVPTYAEAFQTVTIQLNQV